MGASNAQTGGTGAAGETSCSSLTICSLQEALTHNSTLRDTEPTWSDVSKTPLPTNAFADETSRSFPHHFVVNGKKGDTGRFESGDMYLHKGGLDAAWAAAQGARTGRKASPKVIAHLRAHREALGLEEGMHKRSRLTEADKAFKATLLPRLQSAEEEGRVWHVRLIEAGESMNGPIYTEEALREAVTVFEGAPVYTYQWGGKLGATPEGAGKAEGLDHLADEARAVDSRGLAGNLVGSLEGVHYNESARALDGYLKVYDDDTRGVLLNAWNMGDIGEGGQRDILGLSIDAQGTKAPDGRTVVRFTEASSVDIVTTPAAGGRIRRLVASALAQANNDKIEELQGEVARLTERLNNREDSMKTTTTHLQENVGALAGKLKQYADKLSTATDEEAHAILSMIYDDLSGYMGTYMQESFAAKIQEAYGKFAGDDAKPWHDVRMGKYTHEKASYKRMTEGLKDALNTKGIPGKLRETLEGLLPEEASMDAKDLEIKRLKETLADQAIRTELARLAESLRLHDADTAMALIDKGMIEVSDDYTKVTGLQEALTKLVAEKPFLVRSAEPVQEAAEETKSDEEPTTQVGDAQVLHEAKAEPRGQNAETVQLQESLAVQGITTRERAMTELGRLRAKALRGDTRAAVKHQRIRRAFNL